MVFIVISPLNPDPLYKQITDQIKDAIAGGTIEAESRLPSIREMAKELKISAITIKRAYSDLEHEGYIITRSGLGTFVAPINKEKLRQERLDEIRKYINHILKAGEKFQISSDDLIQIIHELEDTSDEPHSED